MFIFYYIFDKSFRSNSIRTNIFFTIEEVSLIYYTCAIINEIPVIYEIIKNFNKSFQMHIDFSQLDEKFINNLNEFSKMYMNVCNMCQNFSEYFLVFNMFNIFVIFLFLCFENYTIYLMIMYRGSWESLALLVFTTTWVLIYCLYFIVFLYYSSLIDHQSTNILNIIENHSKLGLTVKKSKMILILMQQISHQKAQITCGVFKLNTNFLFDLLAHVMSISIVFFQFYGFNK